MHVVEEVGARHLDSRAGLGIATKENQVLRAPKWRIDIYVKSSVWPKVKKQLKRSFIAGPTRFLPHVQEWPTKRAALKRKRSTSKRFDCLRSANPLAKYDWNRNDNANPEPFSEGGPHLLLVEAMPPRCNRAGEAVDIVAAIAIVRRAKGILCL